MDAWLKRWGGPSIDGRPAGGPGPGNLKKWGPEWEIDGGVGGGPGPGDLQQ
jgi:hypothetical protein